MNKVQRTCDRNSIDHSLCIADRHDPQKSHLRMLYNTIRALLEQQYHTKPSSSPNDSCNCDLDKVRTLVLEQLIGKQ